MNEPTGSQGHFAKVAGVYRDVRTTDEKPILKIRNQLAGRTAVTAVTFPPYPDPGAEFEVGHLGLFRRGTTDGQEGFFSRADHPPSW